MGRDEARTVSFVTLKVRNSRRLLYIQSWFLTEAISVLGFNEFSLLSPDLQASIGAKVQEHVETAVKGIGLKRGLVIIKTMIKGGGREICLYNKFTFSS